MFQLHPGLIFFVGSPGTGKTEMCINLLNQLNECFTTVPEHIYYYYEHWQPIYDRLPANTTLVQGVPDTFPDTSRKIIVLDDLADLLMSSHNLYRLASVHARHSETYVFCLKHNLFSKERFSRDLAIAVNYYALFENVRYSTQLTTLARQIMPNKVQFFLDAYRKSVAKYGYLFVDLMPRRTERLLSDILSPIPVVYEAI